MDAMGWGCPNPTVLVPQVASFIHQNPNEKLQVKDASDAVRGDFNALSLLEYHLVSNSAKFTEKGQVPSLELRLLRLKRGFWNPLMLVEFH